MHTGVHRERSELSCRSPAALSNGAWRAGGGRRRSRSRAGIVRVDRFSIRPPAGMCLFIHPGGCSSRSCSHRRRGPRRSRETSRRLGFRGSRFMKSRWSLLRAILPINPARTAGHRTSDGAVLAGRPRMAQRLIFPSNCRNGTRNTGQRSHSTVARRRIAELVQDQNRQASPPASRAAVARTQK